MPWKVRNRKNQKVAVYCFLTAATFWFFNEMGNRFSTDVHFPVKYELSKGLRLEESTDYIFVAVSGTGWSIISNQLGFKIDPVVIHLSQPGKYVIKTADYATFIRSELNGIEMKQIFTDNLSCIVKQDND